MVMGGLCADECERMDRAVTSEASEPVSTIAIVMPAKRVVFVERDAVICLRAIVMMVVSERRLRASRYL